MSQTGEIKEEYDRIHAITYASRMKKLGRIEKVYLQRLQLPWHQIALKLLSKASLKGKRVIEIGCGYGALSIAMARRGGSVLGVEVSLTAIKIAKAMSETLDAPIDLVQSDAQNLSCSTEAFELVVCCETLEHLPDLRSALNEMWRCLKPHGHLILTIPNVLNPIGIGRRFTSRQPFEASLTLPLIKNEIRELAKSEVVDIQASYPSKILKHVEDRLPKSFGRHVGILARKRS